MSRPSRPPHEIRLRCHHGRAVCTYRNHLFTFGAWDVAADAPTPEALVSFQKQVAVWQQNPEAGLHAPPGGVPLVKVWADWLASGHAPRDRRGENGRCGKALFGTLAEPGPLFGRAAASLTAADVLDWQDGLCARKLSRYTVKRFVALLRRCLAWGRVKGVVPAEVVADVQLVPPPPEDATPPPAVRGTVSEAEVMRCAGRMRSALGPLLRALWWTGARPGELTGLAVGQIQFAGELRSVVKAEVVVDLTATGVWAVRLDRHKTRRHGKERVLFFGRRAQEVLAPLLAGKGPGELVFAKRDGTGYTTKELLTAVKQTLRAKKGRAAEAKWTPYQIDHAFLARVLAHYSRKTPGLGALAAKAARGHSLRGVTEVYTGSDLVTAAAVAAELG